MPSRVAACCRKKRQDRPRGFTLLELLIALAIIGTLAGLATPYYLGYLEESRVTRAIAEIHTIELSIDLYQFTNGVFPETLEQAGVRGPVDPWGNPYEYLKIACDSSDQEGDDEEGGKKGKKDEDDKEDDDEDKGKGKGKGKEDDDEKGGNGKSKCKVNNGKARKDRFLHPISSDYDLYSKGKDGRSVSPLTSKHSRDDIIRANDGAFVGLAFEF